MWRKMTDTISNRTLLFTHAPRNKKKKKSLKITPEVFQLKAVCISPHRFIFFNLVSCNRYYNSQIMKNEFL